MDIKVSVIIPVYNEEKYLEQCLQSVMQQTLKEIEIICVDDGSTDRSVGILSRYAQLDNRIKVITQENISAGAARNAGMEIAVGEYFSFLDADDFFEPEMLEKAYAQAIAYDCDIVAYRSGQYDEITKTKNPVSNNIKGENMPSKPVFCHKDVEQDFFSVFVGWTWDKLFRASFIKDNRIYFQNQKSINDLLFVYSALVKAQRISVIKDVLVIKRINNFNSISTNYSQSKNYKCFYEALKALKEKLLEWNLYKEIEQDYVNYALRFSLWNLKKFENTIAHEEIFKLLKEDGFKAFDILGRSEEYFYCLSDFNRMRDICHMSCIEYKEQESIREASGKYLFPFEHVEMHSEIVLYGAGEVGKTFYRQLKYTKYCNVIMWCDKNYSKYGAEVESPEHIRNCKFSKIVIAINSKRIAQEIERELCRLGIDKNMIVWRYPQIDI